MQWKCKYCPASCDKRAQLLKHYRLKHGTYARTERFPCLHQECMCTFKSLNALHSHLSRFHNRSMDQLQTVDSQKKLLKNLKEEFFSVLDSLCPSFMDIFKRKTGGRMGKQLADLLQQTTSTEPTVTRCLILRGLPIILGDDASIFFKSSLNDSMDIPVGIICYEDTSAENAASPASPESSALPKLNPTRVGIILEGSVVMDTLTNLPQAMCLLFGFTYALHLQYPKCLKNTFIFIQQVMLNLGRSELPPKVQKLKNDLAV